jgi:uncharacterized spore protein YtfJ
MNVDEMLHGAQEAMTVRRVYGEAIEQEGVIVVPAAAVRGGGGGGGDVEGNGGGGYGLVARPVGAWVIRDGEVTWRPALDLTRLMAIAAVALLAVARIVRR